MKLTEKYSGFTPEQRKSALLLMALLAAILFLWMPSLSDLQRAMPEPIRHLYSVAQPARPVKPSPFDGRFNGMPRAVVPQQTGIGPPMGTPTSLPPANGNARPVLPEAANVAMPDSPMPVGLLGKYEGRAVLRKRKQICVVAIELDGDGDGAEQVTATSQIQCVDLLAPYPVPGAKTAPADAMLAIAGRYVPVESHLIGTWQNAALHLSVAKTVGDSNECVITSGTLTR